MLNFIGINVYIEVKVDNKILITVSDIHGIKQYNFSSSIKKKMWYGLFITVVLFIGVFIYFFMLNHKIENLNYNNKLLISQNKEIKINENILIDKQSKFTVLEKKYQFKEKELEKQILEIKFKNEQTILKMNKLIVVNEEKKIRKKKALIAKKKSEEKKKALIAKKKSEEKKKALIAKKKSSKKAEKLPAIAKTKLGKKYVWGAIGPRTFDCSGFTSYVYKKTGVNIPRTSRSQSKYGKAVKREHLKAGDLIFFDTSRQSKGIINHVGIYIGNNNFIHASSAKKRVVITSLNKPFYSSRYKWARRVIN